MHIAVFGATGGTGCQVVEQALAAEHTVTALARTPSKLNIQDVKLTVIAGNVLDATNVAKTVTGVDAVVCALGSSSDNPSDIVSKGTQVIVHAMQRERVRRLIVVSSLGVGDSKKQISFTFKLIANTVLRKVMADKERQEEVIKASDLEWTIVRPGGLTDGPKTGSYHFGLDPQIKANQISRADVADFILKQLTDDTFIHKTPAIA